MNSLSGNVIAFNVRGNGAYSSLAILLNAQNYHVALLSGHTYAINQLVEKLQTRCHLSIQGTETSKWSITRKQLNLLGMFDNEQEIPEEIQTVDCLSFEQFSVSVDNPVSGQQIPVIPI